MNIEKEKRAIEYLKAFEPPVDMDIMKMIAEELGRSVSECKRCIHKDVCGKKENGFKQDCENYKSDLNPQIFGNIHEMFDPVFEWMKIHYPTNEVRFVVDYSAAKMYIEHGVPIFDNKLRSIGDLEKQRKASKFEEDKK